MIPRNHAREELPLRLVVIFYVAIIGGLLVALQNFGPAVGVTRDSGLWIWAVVSVVLITTLFGTRLARLVGAKRAWLAGALVFAAGVGVYLYVTEVRLPASIERAGSTGAGR